MSTIPWWHWLPRLSWRIVATVEAADEVPERIPRNGAVLVASGDRLKWLAFDCPCRTGHRVLVNLDASRVPSWRVTNHASLTLMPSVDWRGRDRRCHYLIRRGRVVWVTNKRFVA